MECRNATLGASLMVAIINSSVLFSNMLLFIVRLKKKTNSFNNVPHKGVVLMGTLMQMLFDNAQMGSKLKFNYSIMICS